MAEEALRKSADDFPDDAVALANQLVEKELTTLGRPSTSADRTLPVPVGRKSVGCIAGLPQVRATWLVGSPSLQYEETDPRARRFPVMMR